jgi:hypothetical protein
VKNSSAGKAFRMDLRAGRSPAVRCKVQNPEMAAAPPAPIAGYLDVVARIARAAQAAGRDAGERDPGGVSKQQPWEAIEPVLAAGHRVFGENRVQRALARWRARRPRAFPASRCT